MNSNKCSACGLVNQMTDLSCRRCGHNFAAAAHRNTRTRGPREAAKQSSSIYTLVAVLVIGAVAAYFFLGVQKSYDAVKTTDASRIAGQARQESEPLSRTEYDQKRAGQYGNAIQNSPGLAESQKHLEETQKLMQPQSNKPQK